MIMYDVGTKVREKSNPERIGIVEQVSTIDGILVYMVRFPDRVKHLSESSIVIFAQKQEVLENMLNNHYGEFNDFQKTLTHHKLVNSNRIQNNIYAINTSRTKFYEYQYKPLMKFISSPKRRMMICDEVGLGKTIEAGLIIKELDARKELNKVLIVVPANLCKKWVDELFFRFDETFIVINSLEFRQIIEENPNVRHKYKKERFIVSLESIRSKKMSETLEETDFQWDLLIVDEAHSLRNNSQQHTAIKKLSTTCDGIVFLTATPVHTERKNLFNIINILDELQFQYYDSFEIQLQNNEPVIKALNLISQIPPKLGQAIQMIESVETAFHGSEIYQEVLNEMKNYHVNDQANGSDELEKIVEIQRSLSDLHFLGSTYTRTRKRDVTIGRAERKPQTRRVDFSFEEHEFYQSLRSAIRRNLPHTFPESIFTFFNVQRMLSSSLHAHSRRLIEKYIQDNVYRDDIEYEESEWDYWASSDELPFSDSKLENLLTLLNEVKKHTTKVILFAFYIPTLKYLERMLKGKNYKIHLMHGQIKIDRSKLIKDFKEEHEFSILLSSRVGSEGIDLQFCDTMINYDLPWNPMELEQRIGRIDRIGQKSHFLNIYNFCMADTIDDEIVMRLYDRIALFESSIGLLEPIMGELLDRITKNVFFTNLSDEEKRRQFQQEELILVQKMKDLLELEEKSAEILSLDYFYEHEIKDIKGKNRYISPEQLFRYLVGFIGVRYPDSLIRYDYERNRGELYLCDSFMREVTARDVDIELPFKYRHPKPVKFTMDSDVAFENPDLIFITVMHPLVNYVTERYNEDGSSLQNTQYFCIMKDDLENKHIKLSKGFYFYFLSKGSVIGFKEQSYLIPVILNEDLDTIGSREYNEQVMSALIEKGKPAIHKFTCVDFKYIKAAHQTAIHQFQSWFLTLFRKQKAKHDLVVARKKESIEYNYERKLQHQRDALDKINTGGSEMDERKRFRIDMIEGKINKLNTNQQVQMIKLQAESDIRYEFEEPILGGVFEVT